MQRGSIFSEDDAFESRLILDKEVLAAKIESLRTLGLRIVLTSGSFDLTHIGHMRYLREARRLGDVLVVGVDSDNKIRDRKGEFRPVLPQAERAEMLAHSRYVDILTIKDLGDERWELIKIVRPDVLVVSERTGYSEEEENELLTFCGEVQCLEPQAQTSTSASVRKLQLETLRPAISRIRRELDLMDSELDGEPK